MGSWGWGCSQWGIVWFFFSGCDAGMSCWHGVYSSLSHARYKVRVSGAFAQPHMELLHYWATSTTSSAEAQEVSSFTFTSSRWDRLRRSWRRQQLLSIYHWAVTSKICYNFTAKLESSEISVLTDEPQQKSCSYLTARRLHRRLQWCPTWRLWSRGRESRCWCRRPRSLCPERGWNTQ